MTEEEFAQILSCDEQEADRIFEARRREVEVELTATLNALDKAQS